MNGWNEIKDEKELLIKLFETDHLNVPQRNNLPNGMVRESAARELISNHLKEHGWFPGKKQKPIGDSGGEYFQLELVPESNNILHHNFEYRYLKFKHKTIEYKSVNELITSYLMKKEKEGLDGLKIDWGS